MANVKRKIRLWQTTGEYPELHIMITDNPKYLKGLLAVDNPKAAMPKIEKWLKENYAKPKSKK